MAETLPNELSMHFVENEFLSSPSGETFETLNPRTGEVLAAVALAREEMLKTAVNAAAEASARWRETLPAERGRILYSISQEIESLAEQITRADALDTGRSREDAAKQSVTAARYFSYYAGLADKLEGRQIPLGPEYIDYTVFEPYGVTAHIVPWNFPIQLAARSAAPALAAGNTVVMKSPELAPLQIGFLALACQRAGLPAGVFSLVHGPGEPTGSTLIQNEAVRQVVFTGSVATGKKVAKSCAERLVPCLPELGGKSPALVFPNAELESAAVDIAGACFGNSGQVCSACTRAVVHESVLEQFLELAAGFAGELNSSLEESDSKLGPLISSEQRDRVQEIIDSSSGSKAEIICGGEIPDGMEGFFYPATVIKISDPSLPAAQEELFGPVLSVLPFRTEEEGIHLANDTRYGLVSGVYTQNLAQAHRAASQIQAGQVFINEWFAGGVETPFGGMKESGFGREKGYEAIYNYVQTKNVAVPIRPSQEE